MREAVQSLCHSIGIEARTYATARDFLTTAVSDAPGCIVIDIRLPDLNGFDFQAQLTKMGVRLPVVVMTGFGDIPISVCAIESGVVAFLPNPFHDSDLTCCVFVANKSDR